MKLCSILITDEIRYVNDYNLVSIPLFSLAALAWVLQKHLGSRSLPWFFVWTDGSLGCKRKGWRLHWTTPSCQQWQCAQSRCWGRSYSLGCIQLTLLPSKLQKWHWLLLPSRWPVSKPSTHPVINKKKKEILVNAESSPWFLTKASFSVKVKANEHVIDGSVPNLNKLRFCPTISV